MTRKYKEGIGKCQDCSSTDKELEAAHIHSKSRDILTRKALGNPKGMLQEVDSDDFIAKFKEMHYPLHETFKILCADCHREYDKGTRGFKPGSLDGLEL
ncbi:MAG: hypothetical protein ACYDCN_07940 [Bacteroidia bacterium]